MCFLRLLLLHLFRSVIIVACRAGSLSTTDTYELSQIRLSTTAAGAISANAVHATSPCLELSCAHGNGRDLDVLGTQLLLHDLLSRQSGHLCYVFYFILLFFMFIIIIVLCYLNLV